MESFFYVTVSGNDEIELLEFLHRRYNNVDLLLKMPIEDFCRFVKVGREAEQEEQLRTQWVSMLPLMSIQMIKYMPFEKYKAQCLGENIDTRPADDIIKELETLHNKKLV